MNRVSKGSTTGTEASSTTSAAKFCSHCGGTFSGWRFSGGTSDGGALPPSDPHRQCQELLQLEPPRYCLECGRRLKVQVSPLGWWAACSRHGRSTMA